MDLHKIAKVAELGRGCFIILGREGSVCLCVCVDMCERDRNKWRDLHLAFGLWLYCGL